MFKRFSDVFYTIRHNHNNHHRNHNAFYHNDNRDHHNTFCRNHNAFYRGRNTFCNKFFSKCSTLLYIFYNNPIKALLLFYQSKLIYEV